MQPPRRHSLGGSLKGDGRDAKGHANEGAEGAAQRVARDPNLRSRIGVRDIVVEVGDEGVVELGGECGQKDAQPRRR